MEKRKSIFRQESIERVESPEQLDKYIKVSNPSAWILVGALLLFCVSVLVWSVTGSLPQTVLARGFIGKEGNVHCFVEPEKVQQNWVGYEVQIILPDNSTAQGIVSRMENTPYSLPEVSSVIEVDWIVDSIIESNYVYYFQVEMDKEVQPGILVNAYVVTKEVKPVEYLLN